MKKASEYRQHGIECRALAAAMKPGEQREQLLEMARTWDALAEDRSRLIQRYPELGLRGEAAEETGRPSQGSTDEGLRPDQLNAENDG